jgi:electron transfer flavoprotein alpha subunit
MLSVLSSASRSSLLARCNLAARYVSTLVIADPLVNGVVSPATCSTVTAAQKVGGDDITLLVVSPSPPTQVPMGISHIYHVACGDQLTETVADAVQTVVNGAGKEFGHIMAPASKFGATVVPRAAALLSLSPVTDVTEILEPSECDLRSC